MLAFPVREGGRILAPSFGIPDDTGYDAQYTMMLFTLEDNVYFIKQGRTRPYAGFGLELYRMARGDASGNNVGLNACGGQETRNNNRSLLFEVRIHVTRKADLPGDYPRRGKFTSLLSVGLGLKIYL